MLSWCARLFLLSRRSAQHLSRTYSLKPLATIPTSRRPCGHGEAAAQVPSQVSTLPDPQVTLQHVAVGSPRPFAGYSNSEFAYIGFGISQDIPYPGKLTLKAEAAQRDAAVTRERFEAAKRNVFEQVKASYFQIAYLQKTLSVLERDQTLLIRLKKSLKRAIASNQAISRTSAGTIAEDEDPERTSPSSRTDGQPAGADEQILNRPPGAGDVEAEDLIETPLHFTTDGACQSAYGEDQT